MSQDGNDPDVSPDGHIQCEGQDHSLYMAYNISVNKRGRPLLSLGEGSSLKRLWAEGNRHFDTAEAADQAEGSPESESESESDGSAELSRGRGWSFPRVPWHEDADDEGS